MSIIIEEMQQLVRRHMQDRYGWTPGPDDFKAMTHVELCGAYFDALAHYKIRNNYYSLDEVKDAEEGMWVSIRGDKVTYMYQYKNGKWVYMQDAPDSVYK